MITDKQIMERIGYVIRRTRKETIEEVEKMISVKFDWDRYELRKMLDELKSKGEKA